MTDSLRDRIAAAAAGHADYVSSGVRYCSCGEWSGDTAASRMDFSRHLADAVIRELNIPDRTHVDDEGRVWEWCGGEPGTWAWRITRLHKREKWDCSQSDWSADDD